MKMKIEEILLKIVNFNTEHIELNDVPKCYEFIKTIIPEIKNSYLGQRMVLFSNRPFDSIDTVDLMVCFHFDTVPTYDGNPKPRITKIFDEFTGLEDIDVVYGRGTVDDKPTLAILATMQEEINNSEKNIVIGITMDEETSVLGSKEIVDFFNDNDITVDNILLTEATELVPAVNCMGGVETTYNRTTNNRIEDIPMAVLLSNMSGGQYIPITPPCEGGDYKMLTNNMVICGVGKMQACHSSDEYVKVDELYEFRKRLNKLITEKF